MTLVEILVAMSILVVLMLVVMQTFSGTQVIWRTTQNRTDMYEKARLAMDLLSRDLQGITVSNEVGSEFNYTLDPDELTGLYNPPSPLTTVMMRNREIALVSSSGIGQTSDSPNTIEVGYYYDPIEKKLMRRMSAMNTTGVNSWDCTNKGATIWASSWDIGTSDITDDVVGFTIRAYSDSVTEVLAASMAANSDSTVMPSHFYVQLKMTPAATDTPVYTFTKTIFVDRGQ